MTRLLGSLFILQIRMKNGNNGLKVQDVPLKVQDVGQKFNILIGYVEPCQTLDFTRFFRYGSRWFKMFLTS